MSFLNHNARMIASNGKGNSSNYPIFSSKEFESNSQGKARVQGAFPTAVVKKVIDDNTSSDPWYDVTIQSKQYMYDILTQKLYQPDKTTIVAHVPIPTELQDYKMRMGGRKSRRGKRGARKSRRRRFQ